MKRVILTAILTAAVCFGIVVVQSKAQSQGSRFLTLKVGDIFAVPALSLHCGISPGHPWSTDPGSPTMECERYTPTRKLSRVVFISPWHYEISSEPLGGRIHSVYRVGRTP